MREAAFTPPVWKEAPFEEQPRRRRRDDEDDVLAGAAARAAAAVIVADAAAVKADILCTVSWILSGKDV